MATLEAPMVWVAPREAPVEAQADMAQALPTGHLPRVHLAPAQAFKNGTPKQQAAIPAPLTCLFANLPINPRNRLPVQTEAALQDMGMTQLSPRAQAHHPLHLTATQATNPTSLLRADRREELVKVVARAAQVAVLLRPSNKSSKNAKYVDFFLYPFLHNIWVRVLIDLLMMIHSPTGKFLGGSTGLHRAYDFQPIPRSKWCAYRKE
jgi:hypothetical protein